LLGMTRGTLRRAYVLAPGGAGTSGPEPWLSQMIGGGELRESRRGLQHRLQPEEKDDPTHSPGPATERS